MMATDDDDDDAAAVAAAPSKMMMASGGGFCSRFRFLRRDRDGDGPPAAIATEPGPLVQDTTGLGMVHPGRRRRRLVFRALLNGSF